MINRLKRRVFLIRKRIDERLWRYLTKRDRINFPHYQAARVRRMYYSNVVNRIFKARRGLL